MSRAPMTRQARARRGVALVLVLWLVVILGTIAATVISGTRGASALASNARAAVVARAAAESGIEAAVAAIDDSLASHSSPEARDAALNAVATRALFDSVALGEARFSVVVTDPGTRLDVNAASEESLARLFAYFTDPLDAESIARAIKGRIERPTPAGARTPFVAPGTSPVTHPLRSLEELREIPGIDVGILQLSAQFLTVDGDGSINRALASDTVLAVATGELRDAPSRFVLVSRGWQRGHPLTHEIQATYAIADARLVLVQWRERAL